MALDKLRQRSGASATPKASNSLLLQDELAEILARRGFSAEGARHIARLTVTQGLDFAQTDLYLVLAECLADAEVTIHNRAMLDLALQNYREQHALTKP